MSNYKTSIKLIGHKCAKDFFTMSVSKWTINLRINIAGIARHFMDICMLTLSRST